MGPSVVYCDSFGKLWKEELCNREIEELLSLRNRGRQRKRQRRRKVEKSAAKERERDREREGLRRTWEKKRRTGKEKGLRRRKE